MKRNRKAIIGFMKTYFSPKKIIKSEKEEIPMTPRELLLADIAKTQHALEVAYCGFDNVTDPDLIDCYIYEVNSALKRYRFLLEQARKMQLFIEQPVKTDTTVIPGNLSLYHN